MKTRKVGIIGCGGIGTVLAQNLEKRFPQLKLAAICDNDLAKTKRLLETLSLKPKVSTLAALVKDVDIIVECANQAAVSKVLKECVRWKNKNVIFLSVGALLYEEKLIIKAQSKGLNIFVPSGAIGGIDAIKAAKQEHIDKVILVTSKPPKSFANAPYIVNKKIDLEKIKVRTVIFEGNALEAAKAFPANINVAATLSLAGIGPENTQVKIIADPSLFINVHEITLEGRFGRMVCRTENLPSAANPKTSALAADSALALLEGFVKNIRVGS